MGVAKVVSWYGLVVGGIVSYFVTDYILLLYYHGRYRSEEDFLKLYDLMSERFHFEMFSAMLANGPKDYGGFKKLHSKKRSGAYEKYKTEVWSMIAKTILLIVLTTAPANLILHKDSWLYLLVFTVAVSAVFLYKRSSDKYGVEFYGLLLLSLILR